MNSNRITGFAATRVAISLAFAPARPAKAEGWLLNRWSPAIAASGFAVTAIAASHAIRDKLPAAILSFGSPNSGTIISNIKATIENHRIVGPRAALDTAARVVHFHPELRGNALSAIQALGLSLEAFEARLTAVEAGDAAASDEADEDDTKCPEPTPVAESMSARAAAHPPPIT